MDSGNELSTNGTQYIVTLDVGQGDARVIVTKEEAILTDTDKAAIGEELPSWVNRIDRCFVTHIDEDHTRGLKSLADRDIEMGEIIQPDDSCYEVRDPVTRKPKNGVTQNIYEEYKNNLEEIHPDTITQVTTGDSITLDSGAEIQILGPPPNVDGERPFESPKENSQEGGLKGANENSLAFKFTSEDNRTALFMGDVEDSDYCKAESWYVERHHDPDSEIDLDCDVLFGPHHGSNNAMSAEYIEATDPDVVIFSADPNRYNHPHPDVLERLHEHDGDAEVYLTAIHGTTSTELNEDLTAETEHATEKTITKPWHIAKETAQRRDDPIPQWVRNAELEDQLEAERDKNKKLNEENEALAAKNEALEERLDGREVPAEEAASYETEANEQPERDDESQDLDGDNTETLRERIEKLEALESKNEALNATLRDRDERIENLEAENKGLIDDKKDLVDDTRELVDENRELTNEIMELQQELQQLKANNQQLETERESDPSPSDPSADASPRSEQAGTNANTASVSTTDTTPTEATQAADRDTDANTDPPETTNGSGTTRTNRRKHSFRNIIVSNEDSEPPEDTKVSGLTRTDDQEHAINNGRESTEQETERDEPAVDPDDRTDEDNDNVPGFGR
jgi:beta-lactamase superfamily II metal-dependent hydrolase/phage terminase large subunit-like protein